MNLQDSTLSPAHRARLEQIAALDRLRDDSAVKEAHDKPRTWWKLKREEGRIVCGAKEYKEPKGSGVFISSVSLKGGEWQDRQVTVEYIFADGRMMTPKVCYCSQHRDQSLQQAKKLFEGK